MTIRSLTTRIKKLEVAMCPPVMRVLFHFCSTVAEQSISTEQIIANHLAEHPEDEGRQFKIIKISQRQPDE